ncbi:MAG: tRNA lysidine(34) synthetase TilS [Candidatus Riflebacteria bacterium]|nr:tRNA lysidine(34) synthetase TilS [Candidatus Riflebacteria bacterium]
MINNLQLTENISKFQFRQIGVAVSGGSDSVALLLLLHDYCKSLEIRLHVLHVDHAIRSDSHQDSLWVKELADSLCLPFYCIRLQSPPSQIIAERGFEDWARHQRLNFFSEKSAELGLDCVAVAHHGSDLIETFLIRLIRGTSPESLCGMKVLRKYRISGRKLVLWRPLISVLPEELKKYLTEKQQSWLEDSSNSDKKYLRNRIRHEIIPLFNKIRPRSLSRMVSVISDLGTYTNNLENILFKKKYKKIVSFWKENPERLMLPDQSEKDIFIRLLTKKWIQSYFSGVRHRISRNFLQRVFDLAKNPSCGRKVEFMGKFIIRRSDSLEIIETVKNQEFNSWSARFSLADVSTCVPGPSSSDSDLMEKKYICADGLYGKMHFFAAKCSNKDSNAYSSYSSSNSSNVSDALGIWVPPEMFAAGVFLRYPQPGDQFSPMFGRGKKKLARFFIDKKIPQEKRRQILVVASGKEILWIPGLIQVKHLQQLYSRQISLKDRENWLYIGVKADAKNLIRNC